MAYTVSGGGFEFSIPSVGGTWLWTTRANNINGYGQRFEIIDIRSPFGPLNSVNLPLPGDVVEAMANSITSMTQQVQSSIYLVSPSPALFVLTVTEGSSPEDVGDVIIMNNGAFGSFLTANAVPGAAWLSTTPTQAVGISQNLTATFGVRVDPSQLYASESPYSGSITISDQSNSNMLSTVSVVVTVLPKPVISVLPLTVTFSIAVGSSSSGISILTVSNVGPVTSTMTFTVAKVNNTSAWLSIDPISGGPLIGGESTTVSLSIVAGAVPQIVGVYNDTIRIQSPTASNQYIDIPITLNVTEE